MFPPLQAPEPEACFSLSLKNRAWSTNIIKTWRIKLKEGEKADRCSMILGLFETEEEY